MSQAGRYAHEQNKKRHNQGKSASGALLMGDTIETATWLTSAMAGCRVMAEDHGNLWSAASFSRWCGITEEEAERRLRYMSQLGFLRMSRNKTLNQFEWQLDQPHLAE